MRVYQAVLTHESPLVGKTLADPVFSTLYHATAVGVRAPKATAGQWVAASPSGEETAFWVALSPPPPRTIEEGIPGFAEGGDKRVGWSRRPGRSRVGASCGSERGGGCIHPVPLFCGSWCELCHS